MLKKTFSLSIILAATLSFASVVDTQDADSQKDSGTVACCSGLISSGAALTAPSTAGTETSKLNGIQKIGRIAMPSGSSDTAGGSLAVSGASNYFSDANSVSGSGLYGATSGSGIWKIPAGVSKLQAVIVGGGGGGGRGAASGAYFGGGGFFGGGGGSGYVKAITMNVSAGQQFSWSIGAGGAGGSNGGQTCFGTTCASGGFGSVGYNSTYVCGEDICYGTAFNGGNGGSGGGGAGLCNPYYGGSGGGGGGGFGGSGGGGGGTCQKVDQPSGGTKGLNGGSLTSSGGLGQGSYTSVVTTALTAKPLTGGNAVLLGFTNGNNSPTGVKGYGPYGGCMWKPGYGGTGYGGGGAGGATGGGAGGNGAILIWTE